MPCTEAIPRSSSTSRIALYDAWTSVTGRPAVASFGQGQHGRVAVQPDDPPGCPDGLARAAAWPPPRRSRRPGWPLRRAAARPSPRRAGRGDGRFAATRSPFRSGFVSVCVFVFVSHSHLTVRPGASAIARMCHGCEWWRLYPNRRPCQVRDVRPDHRLGAPADGMPLLVSIGGRRGEASGNISDRARHGASQLPPPSQAGLGGGASRMRCNREPPQSAGLRSGRDGGVGGPLLRPQRSASRVWNGEPLEPMMNQGESAHGTRPCGAGCGRLRGGAGNWRGDRDGFQRRGGECRGHRSRLERDGRGRPVAVAPPPGRQDSHPIRTTTSRWDWWPT